MELKDLLAALKEAQKPGSQLIAAVEAAMEGKPVQARFKSDSWKLQPNPAFLCADCEYRPVPEPKHIWVNDYASSGGSAFLHHTQADAESWAKTNKTFPPITTEYVEVIK